MLLSFQDGHCQAERCTSRPVPGVQFNPATGCLGRWLQPVLMLHSLFQLIHRWPVNALAAKGLRSDDLGLPAALAAACFACKPPVPQHEAANAPVEFSHAPAAGNPSTPALNRPCSSAPSHTLRACGQGMCSLNRKSWAGEVSCNI